MYWFPNENNIAEKIKIIKNAELQKIKLYLALIFVTEMHFCNFLKIISNKQINIIKNKDSQKIQLHWAIAFVTIMYWFPY